MPDRDKVINGLREMSRRATWKDIDRIRYKFQPIINDAINLLKEHRWNTLTEDDDGVIHGLPGDDGQYLMTDGKDIWIDEYMDGVDDGIILDSGRDIREIKAWMYMPELPKTDRW